MSERGTVSGAVPIKISGIGEITALGKEDDGRVGDFGFEIGIGVGTGADIGFGAGIGVVGDGTDFGVGGFV